MASQPGPLTDWPWQKLGNLKYGLLAPWVAQILYKVVWKKEEEERLDLVNLITIPILLLRLLHAQLWISVSRFQTARSRRTIVRRAMDYDQVDRESNWDDQILLTALIVFTVNAVLPGAAYLPWWQTKGMVMVAVLHMGPVEFVYYWFHRALHHHLLYSRYHSHHHASIVTQPVTSVIHPFAEEAVYFLLFSFPLLSLVFTGTGSIAALVGYLTYVDFMNYMGHCNFELVPKWVFDTFPLLKYIMYTPSFHSLHHTQFRTNYSLFMPFYDYLYGTMDISSDKLYYSCREGKDEEADVVHLTHMTNLESIYHMRLGFASLSSNPYSSRWYLLLLWPLTWTLCLVLWFTGSTFTVEKSRMKKLLVKTWAIPRYNFQYKLPWERGAINDLVQKAVLNAEKKRTKVITLGLLNQGDELNNYGRLYLEKNPEMKIKIVDGTSLAAAVVLHSIPTGTKQILIAGSNSKMAYSLALTLCHLKVKTMMVRRKEYELLTLKLPPELQQYLVFSLDGYGSMVWLVDDGLRDEEQKMAAKNTHFIPFSQFPPKQKRKDCTYYCTPALIVPKAYENQHTCENWLPRKAMSAWRIAGIVHALEGWQTHECGTMVMDMEKVWHAAIAHGFLPFQHA